MISRLEKSTTLFNAATMVYPNVLNSLLFLCTSTRVYAFYNPFSYYLTRCWPLTHGQLESWWRHPDEPRDPLTVAYQWFESVLIKLPNPFQFRYDAPWSPRGSHLRLRDSRRDCRNDHGWTVVVPNVVLNDQHRSDTTLFRANHRWQVRVKNVPAFNLIYCHLLIPLHHVRTTALNRVVQLHLHMADTLEQFLH